MEKDRQQEGLNAEDKAFNLFAEMMIEKIESIQENWQKPWFTEGSMWPKNLSGREYNGMNAFMLMFVCEKNGYRIPRFCTFKQVQDLNEEEKGKDLPRVSVKKGETSFPVVFTTFTCVHRETKEKIKYDDYKKLSPEKQELYKVYPGTQVFRVFNVAQTNLQEARPELWAKLEVETRGPKIETGENYAFAPVDKMIQDNLWICPIIPKYQDNAYFSFSENKIVVPEKAQFKDGESFYGTVFHEMTHSTGREGVLNRVKPMGMGSDEYAREELVAEMGAALVAQRYGMSQHIKEESCTYLKAWVDKLKESPQFIKTTLGDVKKATAMMTQKIDYIAQKMEQEQQKDEIHNEPEYKQLDLTFNEPEEEVKYNAMDALLEPEPLRAEVEFANVQRVFEESKAFQFSAPNKITQPRDVAYIFKQLETSAVENVFAVLVKDGIPTVIHLSMGTPRQSLVSLDAAIVADKKINADKVYFVHNHPSGNVYASPEDVAILNKWEQVFGDKMQPGIIINSRTGLFGTFSLDSERTKEDLTIEAGQKQYPIKLYSFSRLVFSKDYKEQGVIRSSSDVASFVAGQRLGARDKLSYLILATNGSIQANVHTAHSSVQKDNVRDLAQQIANDTNVFGGTVVITYGSTPLTQTQVKRLQEELKSRDIVLQDHINVQADVNSLVMDADFANKPYKYQSASDQGWLNYTGWLSRAKVAELDIAEEQDLQPRFAQKAEEFEQLRDLAVKNRGLVVPGLMDKEVPLINVAPHDFQGEKALTQAEIWAKRNLVGEYDAKDNTGEVFSYSISGKAIEKYLSNSATMKSDSIGVHLSVLKRLPDVIADSAEVEIHPDYLKGADDKRRVENGYNSNVLMHRFYGAIDILGQTYRVKTTIQEYANPGILKRPHSYEVTKIEMLDLKPSISLAPTPEMDKPLNVGLAKLLHGVEKSYDPGKKILEESQRLQQGILQNQEKSLQKRLSVPSRKVQPKNRKRGRGL